MTSILPRLCRALALAAALLTSCSSPDSPTAGSAPVRIRWPRDPETLDPLELPNQYAIDVANLLHCSLLQVDFTTGTFAPSLAASLPRQELVGDSLLRLHYELRTATWDNGHPVLAADVALTLKLMAAPGGLPNEGTQAQYGFIKGLLPDAANPRRFTLVCRGQSPEFAHASGDFFILPEAALDPAGELRPYSLAELRAARRPAPLDSALHRLQRRYQRLNPGQHPEHLSGCGPYRLVSWQKNRFLTLARKSAWWADQLRPAPFVLRAHPPRLQFVIVPDDATATLALRNGNFDVYPGVPAREFERLRQSAAAKQRLAFYTAPSYDVVTAGFNTRRPALHDALTRQALSRLFDPTALLQATQLGAGQRTVGLISPTERRYYYDSIPLLTFDPTTAQHLLQQAGWQRAATGWQRPGPHGEVQRLALVVRYRTDESTFATIGLQLRGAASQLGIPVELRPTEASTLTATLQAGDFDLYIRTLKGNPFVSNFTPILHSQAVGEGNLTGFGTPASDRLIEAVAAAGPAQKASLLHKFQLMLREQMPIVPLFFLPYRIAADRQLRNLHVTGLKPGYAAQAITRAPAAPAR